MPIQNSSKNALKAKKQALFIIKYNDNKLIGFKVGYLYNEIIFYSWFGCVNPKYRKQGIATHLSILQDEYAKNKGFDKLRTKSMMILNLKNRFKIIKVNKNTKGQTKIVFEKLL